MQFTAPSPIGLAASSHGCPACCGRFCVKPTAHLLTPDKGGLGINVLLSIIIPVYNAAQYLPSYLERLVSAQLPEIELLLVDDGSSDNSAQICRSYAARYPWIRYFYQENAGPSAARNRGLQAATGDYVAFHDSDDRVDMDAFSKTVSLLRRYEADIWASDFCRVADNGAVLDRVFQIPDTPAPLFGEAHARAFVTSGDCVWNVWRYLFRRDYLLSHDLWFLEGYHCGEDMELVIRALTGTTRIAFYHNPYYAYRISYGGTLTRRYSAARTQQLSAMLSRAQIDLEAVPGPMAPPLLAMLSREYILNLSLYAEAPKGERRQALSALRECLSLLPYAAGPYRAAARFVRIMGIRCSAWLLLALKRIKRGVRTYRQRRYAASVGDHTGL